jgi:hypothetical protein
MEKNRGILLLLFSVVLSGLVLPSQAVDLPDEQTFNEEAWNEKHPGGVNDKTFGVWFSDMGPSAVASTSYLLATTNNGVRICKSLEECKDESEFFSMSFLPFCSDGFTTNCISNVSARKSANQQINFTKRTYFPQSARDQFKESPKYQLPAGWTASVVEFPKLLNSVGKNTYSVAVYIIHGFTITDRDKGLFTSGDPMILANIAAVDLVSGNYKARETIQGIDRFGRMNLNYSALNSNIECVVIDNGVCGKPVGFPEKTNFALQLKLNAKTHGWMHGRLTNGKIKVINESSESTDIEISGEPSRIPTVLVEAPIDKVTEPMWAAVMGPGGIPKNYGSKEWPPLLNVVASNRGTYMMSAFNALQPLMSDRAYGMPFTWSVRSVERDQVVVASGQKALNCLYKNGGDKGKILGFVNTNATSYVSGPPTFNEQTQSLDYSVAAPHFAKDGSVFKGNYTIQLEANTARCMFGLQGSSFKATLSVTNDKGEVNVVTSIAREDKGWFNFQIAGFTFSAPKISLKLEQDLSKPAITSPQPSQANKKITCIKGKLVKTVSGSDPKCPTGFKKK